jgi:hypothetical protein
LPVSGRFDVVVHQAARQVFELVEQPNRAMENVENVLPRLEYCRQQATP